MTFVYCYKCLMSRFCLKGRLMYAEAMEIAKKNSRLFT